MKPTRAQVGQFIVFGMPPISLALAFAYALLFKKGFEVTSSTTLVSTAIFAFVWIPMVIFGRRKAANDTQITLAGTFAGLLAGDVVWFMIGHGSIKDVMMKIDFRIAIFGVMFIVVQAFTRKPVDGQ